MSTFMANKANIERKWYILDAAGKPLGKTAGLLTCCAARPRLPTLPTLTAVTTSSSSTLARLS